MYGSRSHEPSAGGVDLRTGGAYRFTVGLAITDGFLHKVQETIGVAQRGRHTFIERSASGQLERIYDRVDKLLERMRDIR